MASLPARKGAWAKPLPKASLRDIQSEQLAESLTHGGDAVAAKPAATVAVATPPAVDDDFALALRLQQEEGGLPPGAMYSLASGQHSPSPSAGSAVPSRAHDAAIPNPPSSHSATAAGSSGIQTVEGASGVPSAAAQFTSGLRAEDEDGDLALALALQEEEEALARGRPSGSLLHRLPSCTSSAPGGVRTALSSSSYAVAAPFAKVQVVPRGEHDARRAERELWAATAASMPRRLYGADDALGGSASSEVDVGAQQLHRGSSREGYACADRAGAPEHIMHARAQEPGSSGSRSSVCAGSSGASASAAPSWSGGPHGHHLTAQERSDLAEAHREASEESLYQALQGSGRREGYLTVPGAGGDGDGVLVKPAFGHGLDEYRGIAGGVQDVDGDGGAMPGPGGGAAAEDATSPSAVGPSATDPRSNLSALGADGFLTKHDPYLSGRRNARTLERRLGQSAGDLSRLTVSQPAVGTLQRFLQRQTVKGTAAHGRVEGSTHATSEGVLDQRTRMILFRLLGSARFDAVSGTIATGKEANVYLACNWHPDVHAELSCADRVGDGWAQQKSRVWGGIDEEGNEEGEGVEGEGEADNVDGRHGDDGLDVAVRSKGRPLDASEAAGATRDDALADDREDPSILHGVNADGSQDVALKIFKLTLNEFKDRKAYMAGDRRYAKMNLRKLNPRKIVTAWAEKEFKNLVRIHRAGIPSPAPLLLSGHVLVMSFLGADGFPAPQLRHAQLTERGWDAAYRQVVAIMSGLYKWTHLVHGDLSEYNLLYWDGRVHVIDVGQAVDMSHPSAEEFLHTDARNMTAFFHRMGVQTLPPGVLIDLIKDPAVAPHPPASAERTGSYAGTIPSAGSGIRRARTDTATHSAAAARAPFTGPAGSDAAARLEQSDTSSCSGCLSSDAAAPLPLRSKSGSTAASAAGDHGEQDDQDDAAPCLDSVDSVAPGRGRHAHARDTGVEVEDFDVEELFSGKKGAVVRAVNELLELTTTGSLRILGY